MTTAHRPTFDPARGKEAARGEAYHQRLLPAHKILKYRQANQGAPNEQARRDLRAELLKNERKHFAKKEGREIADDDEEGQAQGEQLAIEEGAELKKRKLESEGADADEDGQMGAEDYEAKKRRVLEETKDVDASSESGSSSSEEESDSEDDDEEAELQRELNKIKAERAEAAAREAAEKAKKDEDAREKDIALGNPLLNAGREEYGVKRRWDDDVVFKNQARGTEERGKEKHFVNDLLRSDFHKKFMDRYVR